MSLKIYGASDDLIELEGDITDEIYALSLSEDVFYLALSDGTVLSIEYDNDGIWRIHTVFRGNCAIQKTDGDVESDTNDVVILTGNPIKWAIAGKTLVLYDHKGVKNER